jgi:sulfatase maturation enzyme AslB (radical SAM superfamily)
MPWNSIGIGLNGDVFLCQCEAWLPTNIGNIWDDDLATLMQSDTARAIRRSIIDGNYEYCNESVCYVLQQQELQTIDQIHPQELRAAMQDEHSWLMPTHIMLALDPTCNLSCPSCRTEVTKKVDDDQDRIEYLSQRLITNLFGHATNQQINVTVSTSGELFASEVLMRTVNQIDLDLIPGLNLQIQTNGLLLPKRWSRIADKHNNIGMITVTVDAATADTYEIVRRGGRWSDMLAALDFIRDLKQSLGFELRLRMVVQKTNYQEAPAFYDLAQNYLADLVEYTRLTNWHTWPYTEFKTHDILDPNHPKYKLAQTVLGNCINRPSTWHNFVL